MANMGIYTNNGYLRIGYGESTNDEPNSESNNQNMGESEQPSNINEQQSIGRVIRHSDENRFIIDSLGNLEDPDIEF